MPRNVDKDTREEAKRRKQILEAGLMLFSERGIESVSMNAVAAVAGVGPTTLFKYYQTKEKLVIAISAMAWSNIWQDTINRYGLAYFSNFTAYQMIVNYTENMIRLYKEKPQLLRFSGNYKTFICRQHTQMDDVKEHLDSLAPIKSAFHNAYLRAKEDHSIRTDISEDTLFSSVAISMLAIAERYAQGIVWADNGEKDHTFELKIAQQMILNWCTEGAEKPDLNSVSDK